MTIENLQKNETKKVYDSQDLEITKLMGATQRGRGGRENARAWGFLLLSGLRVGA